MRQLRTVAGVLLKDWLRYRLRMSGAGAQYLGICNRNERLQAAPQGDGYRCAWQWTSQLHAPTIFPDLGLRLMRRALSDHPVRRLASPAHDGVQPDISFIIGHRGAARLALLRATLESIAAQRRVLIECIVVEQDTHSSISDALPAWVRHVHTPPPHPAMPYSRSWAFNVGAKRASGRVLVLHDNDMLVSDDYALSVMKHVDEGYDVINLKRFVFYLGRRDTSSYLNGKSALDALTPQLVVQNTQGGGSVAITARGYDKIGGMDESFVGWGGEDNEFWDRAQTLRVWPYGYLPMIHLWHPAQAGKDSTDNAMVRRFKELAQIAAADRIGRLNQIERGLVTGPAGFACARS
jgi:hypothetical protein